MKSIISLHRPQINQKMKIKKKKSGIKYFRKHEFKPVTSLTTNFFISLSTYPEMIIVIEKNGNFVSVSMCGVYVRMRACPGIHVPQLVKWR